MDVVAWLRGLGLEEYAPAFRDNDIDGDPLRRLTTSGNTTPQSSDVRSRQGGVTTDQVGCSLGQCHNNRVDMC
jgi:hypothetical protein